MGEKDRNHYDYPERRFHQSFITGKNEDRIYDTTNEEVARANDIYNEKGKYGGDVIIVGSGHTVAGLDEEL